MVPVQSELCAAMIRACDPHTRATSSTVTAKVIESRPAPSYSSGIAIPRNPRPAIFAIVAFLELSRLVDVSGDGADLLLREVPRGAPDHLEIGRASCRERV